MDIIHPNVLKVLEGLEKSVKDKFNGLMVNSTTQNAIDFIREKMKYNDPSHDFRHVFRVMNLSLLIYLKDFSNDEEVDIQLIILSALFHDIADFKYEMNIKLTSEELIRQRLHEFFLTNPIPTDKLEKIIYIVSNISFRKELEGTIKYIPKELMIVRDADRLEALGAIGIARTFGYSSIANQIFYDPSIKRVEKLTAEIYNQQTLKKSTTSFNHLYEKVLHLKERMLTNTGKSLALSRHQFILSFLSQFEDEMNFLK